MRLAPRPRLLLRGLTTLLIGLAGLAGGVPAAAAGVNQSVDTVGTIELLHGENFETDVPLYQYTLQTPTGRLRLHFAGDAPEGFVSGAVVRVHGRRGGALA